jgi:membrane protein DedA with SNARE-associated domain
MLWIKDHLLTLIEQYGVIALFFSIFLETLGLPVPGESALIVSSAAAGAGKLSIWHVVMAAYVAAVLGDNIGYLIGRRYGKAVILRYGDRFGITHEKYLKAEAIAAKYGPFMVIAARFIVLLRQLNGLVAGSVGMHWATFLGANLIGAALWVGLWSALAYQFGHDVTIVPWIWDHLALVAMAAIPVLLLVIVLLYQRSRRKKDDITPM